MSQDRTTALQPEQQSQTPSQKIKHNKYKKKESLIATPCPYATFTSYPSELVTLLHTLARTHTHTHAHTRSSPFNAIPLIAVGMCCPIPPCPGIKSKTTFPHSPTFRKTHLLGLLPKLLITHKEHIILPKLAPRPNICPMSCHITHY